MIAALLIFLATIGLVIWQPRGLGIGWSAAAGAAIALLIGVVSLGDIPVVWHIVWNATTTFVAIITISLLLMIMAGQRRSQMHCIAGRVLPDLGVGVAAFVAQWSGRRILFKRACAWQKPLFPACLRQLPA